MDMASHNSFTHVRAGVADYFSELTVVERVVESMFGMIYSGEILTIELIIVPHSTFWSHFTVYMK